MDGNPSEAEPLAASAASDLVSRETPRALFTELVVKNYSAVGLREEGVADYVIALLVEFVAARHLFPPARGAFRRDAGGNGLAALLVAGDPVRGGAESFEVEAVLRRRVGDLALFFTGMFPTSLSRRRGGDAFLDYIAAGKESYHIVCEYERSRAEMAQEADLPDLARGLRLAEPRPGAPVFARLSEDFERCMYGLNLVRDEIESFREPAYREVRALFM